MVPPPPAEYSHRFWVDPTIMAFLRAAPADTAEKQAAIDLAMKGIVLCVLGTAFPPILLLGVLPLYYGVRKLLLVSFGISPRFPLSDR